MLNRTCPGNLGPLLLLFLFVFAPRLGGEELYVTSRIGPLLDAPRPDAGRVSVLRQGESMELIEERGDWFLVHHERGRGYIRSRFVGDTPSPGRGETGRLQNISAVSVRRRASAYTTSAAATRGLEAEDNPRARENLAFSEYNFAAVRWIKQFDYSEDELIEFAEREGLGL